MLLRRVILIDSHSTHVYSSKRATIKSVGYLESDERDRDRESDQKNRKYSPSSHSTQHLWASIPVKVNMYQEKMKKPEWEKEYERNEMCLNNVRRQRQESGP